jgi:hypothetical protein
MDTTTTTHDTPAVVVASPAPQVPPEVLEQVLIGGDLAALIAAQRLAYYQAGSAKEVMLATQLPTTVDLNRLAIQRRSIASYGRARCLPSVSIAPLPEKWPYSHRQTDSSRQSVRTPVCGPP